MREIPLTRGLVTRERVMEHNYQAHQKGDRATRIIYCTRCGQIAYNGGTTHEVNEEYQRRGVEPCLGSASTPPVTGSGQGEGQGEKRQ